MTARAKYSTKQKEILLEFFKQNPGVHLTAGDVVNHLKNEGATIGQATIYRNLESLVSDGVIAKFKIDDDSPACFEYISPDEHIGDEEDCYHCKCSSCGKIIHVSCEDVKALQEHFMEEHGFKIDLKRTVFYGLCGDCSSSK
jgi:Fur family ferric uptake transcriptional regulator